MKTKFLILLAVVAPLASAQPAAPKAVDVCDVTYVVDVDTGTNDVMTSKATLFGLPKGDMEDNSKKGMRVIDLASKLQDKGGPYNIEMGEVRTCNGVTQKFAPNSILVKGVNLDGANQINRLSLQVLGEIVGRYEARQKMGTKHAWDHGKGHKTKRDDLGNKKFD